MNNSIFPDSHGRVSSIESRDNQLTINWSDGHSNRYHYIWLRDNCRSASRFDHRTGERIAQSEQIPQNLTASAIDFDDRSINIMWSDGTENSHFTAAFLREHAYDQPDKIPSAHNAVFWDSSYSDKLVTFDYQEVFEDDSVASAMIQSFEDYGLIKLSDAPTSDREVERFANRISYVREIAFDRVANIQVSVDPYNIGFTDQALPLHTDCSGYSWPPNVMVFHCLQNEVAGGESHYVDGASVAQQLRHEEPEAFALLSTTNVEFRLYADKADTLTKAPPILLHEDKSLRLMRYANWTVQPLKSMPFDTVPEYYSALRALAQRINDPKNLVRYRCEPGDMLLINNHRALHGRGSFDGTSGTRHFQQVYMELDDLVGFTRIFDRAQAYAS